MVAYWKVLVYNKQHQEKTYKTYQATRKGETEMTVSVRTMEMCCTKKMEKEVMCCYCCCGSMMIDRK